MINSKLVPDAVSFLCRITTTLFTSHRFTCFSSSVLPSLQPVFLPGKRTQPGRDLQFFSLLFWCTSTDRCDLIPNDCRPKRNNVCASPSGSTYWPCLHARSVLPLVAAHTDPVYTHFTHVSCCSVTVGTSFMSFQTHSTSYLFPRGLSGWRRETDGCM